MDRAAEIEIAHQNARNSVKLLDFFAPAQRGLVRREKPAIFRYHGRQPLSVSCPYGSEPVGGLLLGDVSPGLLEVILAYSVRYISEVAI